MMQHSADAVDKQQWGINKSNCNDSIKLYEVNSEKGS